MLNIPCLCGTQPKPRRSFQRTCMAQVAMEPEWLDWWWANRRLSSSRRVRDKRLLATTGDPWFEVDDHPADGDDARRVQPGFEVKSLARGDLACGTVLTGCQVRRNTEAACRCARGDNGRSYVMAWLTSCWCEDVGQQTHLPELMVLAADHRTPGHGHRSKPRSRPGSRCA
jgi:hypothetical protein